MSSWLQPLCGRKKCVKVCIECCVCGSEGVYKVKVPSSPVAVVATKSTAQAYSSTAVNVLFNNVVVNEGSPAYNRCGSCNYDPCCCKKKKKCKCKKDPCECRRKKKHCDDSSSCNPCRNAWPPMPPPCGPCGGPMPPCGPCPPPPCGPCGGPLYGQQGQYPNQWGYCQFYNSSTGVATVPADGGGFYVMSASVVTDAINGFIAEIRLNGQVIANQSVPAGQTTAMLVANRDLYDWQQVSVVVYGSTPANVTGGNLAIARVSQ